MFILVIRGVLPYAAGAASSAAPGGFDVPIGYSTRGLGPDADDRRRRALPSGRSGETIAHADAADVTASHAWFRRRSLVQGIGPDDGNFTRQNAQSGPELSQFLRFRVFLGETG